MADPEDEVKAEGTFGESTAAAPGKRLYLIWWVLGTLLQILLFLPGVWKRLNWKALLITLAVFVLVMTTVESFALYWQWWVWDQSKLLGPKVGLIPLEEFLLYFLVVPSLATMQTAIEMLLEKIRGN